MRASSPTPLRSQKSRFTWTRARSVYRRWALFARSVLPKIVEYGLATEKDMLDALDELRDELVPLGVYCLRRGLWSVSGLISQASHDLTIRLVTNMSPRCLVCFSPPAWTSSRPRSVSSLLGDIISDGFRWLTAY